MDWWNNRNANIELKVVESFLKTFKKPSITLPESYVNIPEEYKSPYIVVSNGNVGENYRQNLKTLQVYRPQNSTNVVYVTLSSDDNKTVNFVYVVFKGEYYMVLQVGINRTDTALVIVSIKQFDKNEELKKKETEMGVIDTLTLYSVKNPNLSYYYNVVIIKMLLKKYPSVSTLNPNDVFFTQEDNTMSRFDAFNFKGTIFKKFSEVVNLCIFDGRLYLCIGLKDDDPYNPRYELCLYGLNGTEHKTFSFQPTGFQNGQFSALTRGWRTPVGEVNNMKFYSLNEALSFKPTESTSTVGSRGYSPSMTFSTEPRPDYYSGSSAWEGNRGGGSCRRKSKRKYKRTRTSKINKKARKTHTRRIRR